MGSHREYGEMSKAHYQLAKLKDCLLRLHNENIKINYWNWCVRVAYRLSVLQTRRSALCTRN